MCSSDLAKWEETITDLNNCSQRGLVERFDSSIGSNTVIMPFGGKYQLTPAMGMVARIPTLKGYTNSGTIMSYGYNPYIASWSPFHGAVYAIIESVSKYVALGGDYKKAYLTLQEYASVQAPSLTCSPHFFTQTWRRSASRRGPWWRRPHRSGHTGPSRRRAWP